MAVETAGLFALLIFTIGVLWQAILAGYTLMLASRAADQAAREAAVQMPHAEAAALGEAEGNASLPGAWQSDATIDVTISGGSARAEADLQIPLVVPGWQSFPMRITSSSGASP